jgi:hypothetical protein
VRTRSAFDTFVIDGVTVTSLWRRIASAHVVHEDRSRAAVWRSRKVSAVSSPAFDRSARRSGSLRVTDVAVTVPLYSSSTFGKRTPRPTLARNRQAPLGGAGERRLRRLAGQGPLRVWAPAGRRLLLAVPGAVALGAPAERQLERSASAHASCA